MVRIELTQSEFEICTSACGGEWTHRQGDSIYLTCDTYQAYVIAQHIENAISTQINGDDWLRAQEWMNARNGLIAKLRKVLLTPV